MVNICKTSGIPRTVSNHSLRATCATRLYHANIDKQTIMERIGNRSVTGVRTHKRRSDVHIENCSAILDGKTMRQLGLRINLKDSEHEFQQRVRLESKLPV